MQPTTKLLAAAAVFALVGASIPAAADTLDDNMVVRAESGQVVRSIAFGTCVRTKWDAGSNPCGTEVASNTVTRTTLSEDEKTVYFGFDSARLTPESRTKLDSVARRLKDATDVKSANIVGYADRIGTSDYNVRLSEARAKAVKNYLSKRGYLNTNVVKVRGLGESGSVTSCDDSLPRDQKIACLSADRRVEVEVQYLDTNRYSQAR